MPTQCRGFAILGLLMLPVNCLADDKLSSLLRRIEARRSAIYSGKIRVRKQIGPFRNGDRKATTNYDFIYSIEGRRWARRAPGYPNTRVNASNACFKYVENEQPDGSIHPGLRVEDPVLLKDSESTIAVQQLGSLWYKVTLTYLKANQERIRRREAGDTTSLSLRVPPDDVFKAFASAPGYMLQEGGMLELDTDESRGCVVTKLTFSGKSQVGIKFVATDFERHNDAIYLPRISQRTAYHEDGTPMYFERYELLSASRINQAIPQEEFELSVPEGTFISNGRSGGTGMQFRLGQEDIALEDAVAMLGKRPDSRIPGVRPYLLAGAVACVLLVMFVFGRRIVSPWRPS